MSAAAEKQKEGITHSSSNSNYFQKKNSRFSIEEANLKLKKVMNCDNSSHNISAVNYSSSNKTTMPHSMLNTNR